MKHRIASLATTALIIGASIAFPAAAQNATPAAGSPAGASAAAAVAAPAVGATIYDTAGGVSGTVESVAADGVVLNTGKNKVALPLTSIATGPKGPTISMTAAQIDEAAAAAAAREAALHPPVPAGPPKLEKGMAVSDTSGGAVGTIDEVGPDYAIVATSRNKVRLASNAFAAGSNGPMIAVTAEKLDELADAAKPKPVSAPVKKKK